MNAQDPLYPRAFLAWISVFILSLFYLIAFADRLIMSLLAAAIQRDLELSDTQVGLLQGYAFILLYSTAGLVLGWAVDRYSRRLVIFCGIIVWSLSCAAGAFASSFETLFLSRLAVGAGEAALLPGAYSILRDLFPPKRLTTALAVFSAAGSLSVAASYAFSGNLIAILSNPQTDLMPLFDHFRPWQAGLLIFGAPGVFLSFLIWFLPEPARRQSAQPKSGFFGPVAALVRQHPLLLPSHLVGFSLAVVAIFTIFAWTPLYLERRFGWQPWEIGNALALSLGVSTMISALASGFIADRLFSVGMTDVFFRGMRFGLVVTMLAVIVAFLAPAPAICIAALAIAGLSIGMTNPFAIASLNLIAPPELRGRLSSVYLLALNIIGAGGGPLVVGLITDHVFADRAQINLSLIITVCGACILSIGLLSKAMTPFREMLRGTDLS